MKGLQVQLTIDEKGCDEELLSDVTYFLQQELQELDSVAAVTHAPPRPPDPTGAGELADSFELAGSGGLNAASEQVAAANTLIIVLNYEADPTTFVAALAAWLSRHPFRSIKLRVGGFETSASELTGKQQQALIAWFRKQLFKEEPLK